MADLASNLEWYVPDSPISTGTVLIAQVCRIRPVLWRNACRSTKWVEEDSEEFGFLSEEALPYSDTEENLIPIILYRYCLLRSCSDASQDVQSGRLTTSASMPI